MGRWWEIAPAAPVNGENPYATAYTEENHPTSNLSDQWLISPQFSINSGDNLKFSLMSLFKYMMIVLM
jgi:hypothetical protein